MSGSTPFNLGSGTGFISTGSGTTVFEVPDVRVRTISKLLITNTHTSNPATISIFHVRSGGSMSGDDHVLVKALSVGPSDGLFGVEDIREVVGEIFMEGDKLVLVAGTSSVLKYSCSGVESNP